MALIADARLDDDVNVVCSAASYLRDRGITRSQLETVNGISYAPGTRFGNALQAALDRGRIYQVGDRYMLALPPRREPTLVRPKADTTIAEIVADHTPAGGDPDRLARLQRMKLQLQMFVSDVTTMALDSYKIVDDGDRNLLFAHTTCAWQQWGEGDKPPSTCRRCAQPATDWTPMYVRSTVTVRRDRGPVLPNEPALIAALRGAFSDRDLASLNEPDSPARQRLEAAIANAVGGL